MTSLGVTPKSSVEYIDTPTEVDVNVVRGDSTRWRMTVQDIDGSALNLTGYTFSGMVRRSYDSTEVIAPIQISCSAPLTGVVDLMILPVYTTTLGTKMVAGGTVPAIWDAQAISPAATPVIITFGQGSVSFQEDVTH